MDTAVYLNCTAWFSKISKCHKISLNQFHFESTFPLNFIVLNHPYSQNKKTLFNFWIVIQMNICSTNKLYSSVLFEPSTDPEAEFKEFEPRLKYGWFHLKLY